MRRTERPDVVMQAHLLRPEERLGPHGLPPCTLWFTGLPGAGKTTLAMRLEAVLVRSGRPAFALDGDNLRHGLSSDLGFSDADRTENVRRAAELCRLFNEAGVIALCALVSPLASQRELARRIVGADRFVEVHVATPLAVCESRDPKGLYRRAREGGLKGLTGLDAPYEPPIAPDLRLDTSAVSVEQALATLMTAALAAARSG